MIRMPLPRDWNSLSQKHPTLFKIQDVSKKLGFALYKAVMLIPMFIAHFVLYFFGCVSEAFTESLGHAIEDCKDIKRNVTRAPGVAFGQWYDSKESKEFKQAVDTYRYHVRKGR